MPLEEESSSRSSSSSSSSSLGLSFVINDSDDEFILHAVEKSLHQQNDGHKSQNYEQIDFILNVKEFERKSLIFVKKTSCNSISALCVCSLYPRA